MAQIALHEWSTPLHLGQRTLILTQIYYSGVLCVNCGLYFWTKLFLSAGICAVTTFVERSVASILIYALVIPISILIGWISDFLIQTFWFFSNQAFDIRFSSRNWRWNWALSLFPVLVRYKNLKYRRPKPSLMRSLDFRNACFGYPRYGLNLRNTTAYTLVSLPSYSAGLFRKCHIALTGVWLSLTHQELK